MTVYDYLRAESATYHYVESWVINSLPDIWIINRLARPAVARLFGMQCGPGTFLQKNVFYGNPRGVTVGRKSTISRGAFLDTTADIRIGDNVAVGFGVMFITSQHAIGPKEKRLGKLFGKPIVIEDGVWIASGAIIGPGTTVGAGSVISAGAVLMHSVPPNSLVAGVPARVIKQLDQEAAPIPVRGELGGAYCAPAEATVTF